MSDLLNCKHLLKNERVRRAYWGLFGCNGLDKVGLPIVNTDPVPGPIEKVAFEMRDACIGKLLPWMDVLWREFDAMYANESDAREWIIAAVLAWEESQK
jgi:hypothetical protein